MVVLNYVIHRQSTLHHLEMFGERDIRLLTNNKSKAIASLFPHRHLLHISMTGDTTAVKYPIMDKSTMWAQPTKNHQIGHAWMF